MGTIRSEPLPLVDFRCQDCGHQFECAPDFCEEDLERPWHPWAYSHTCPNCSTLSNQDPRQRGLLKAWAHATGPKTVEGKAASAANLEGHPTPEESQTTRMNALKHGAYANTVSFFPARPGKYATCEVCDYYDDVCKPNPGPYHENPKGCLKRAELYMRHQIAFETGDSSLLRGIRSDTQAGLQAIIDEMILQIAQDGGPRIKEIAYSHDKDGGFHLSRYRLEGDGKDIDEEVNGEGEWVQIYNIKAHPLLKPLIDFISKNSLTLADMGMTPKVQQENELLAGHLKGEKKTEQDAIDFRDKQQAVLEQLRDQIKISKERVEKDPVLLEYNQGESNG